MRLQTPEEGRYRVVVSAVFPEVDGGRFPIKRSLGETVQVRADVFADGHDAISCVLLYRKKDEPEWSEAPMSFEGNDRWRGEFRVDALGSYVYTIEGWIDHFKTWRSDLRPSVPKERTSLVCWE
jgi:starch synthase (maltosyl-transferring)